MKKLPAIFFLFFYSLVLNSQGVIKGVVVNEATGVPIPGSSVFISNSSKGTITSNNGQFEITSVPNGKHELVISCIGYETNVFSFSEKDLPLQLRVQLAIKVQELQNVTVEPFLEEGWDKWGKMFMENFIGTTDNSLHCKIINTKKIKFRYYKKSNRVIAYCDEPIVIDNNALGYMIKYQLEEFEVNFKEGTTFYLGYPLFEDKTKDGKEPKNKWSKKRQEAFDGSVNHFMRALYANKLSEENFEVRRMVRSPNYEKERVKAIYKQSIVTRKESAGTNVIKIDNILSEPGDSMSYYQRIMRQPDHIDNYSAAILSADSLIVSSEAGYKGLYFQDYIFVTYKGEKEETAYLRSIMQSDRNPAFQRSLVVILNEELITFDALGNYYNPMNFLTTGYWGWSEKMANLLPSDYSIKD